MLPRWSSTGRRPSDASTSTSASCCSSSRRKRCKRQCVQCDTVIHILDSFILTYLIYLVCAHRLEKELAQARQQNDLTAQLSRKLANAQRDIRELHRKNSIQSLLKGSNALAATGGTRSTAAARMAGHTEYAPPFSREAMPPPPSPVSPSSTSSRSSNTSSSSSPASNNTGSNQQQQQLLLLQQLVSQPNKYLVRCPDKLLMHIFTFLDANSVFAVSLTNHSLLARVHIMFGMTTSVVAAANGSARRGRTAAAGAAAQASPKPRLQPKNRSQSSITPSEKEKAQVRSCFVDCALELATVCMLTHVIGVL